MKEFQKVCLACGSINLTTLATVNGGIPGASDISGMYHCRECGWRGFPVEVEDVEKFKKQLNQEEE